MSTIRTVLQTMVDALEHVTTSETFHRDPRGDRAGPAIDAGRALLAELKAAPSDSNAAQTMLVVKQIIDQRNAARDMIRTLETMIADQQELIDDARAPFMVKGTGQLASPETPPAKPGMVTANFPIIAMGHGKVEVGDAMWEGLPTLWFGNEGRGLGVERDRTEPAKDGETLVMFTFANLQGLEAIEAACARVRANMEAAAQLDQAAALQRLARPYMTQACMQCERMFQTDLDAIGTDDERCPECGSQDLQDAPPGWD